MRALVGFVAQYSYCQHLCFQQVVPFIIYEKDSFLSINDRRRKRKNSLCPVCLETFASNLYFASDNHLYHQICFSKLNFKSPISREDFSYYLPVNKVVNGKVYFEKKLKHKFKTTIYDLDGFNEDGFYKKGFHRDEFNKNRTDENGFNRNKVLACEEKVKQAIRENPWNNYYASEVFRNKYKIIKECVEADPNTYQYASLHLKNKNVNLAIFFLELGGSYSLISKHLRNNTKVGMIAVKINPNNFQCLGKNLKDDDELFKLAFQQDNDLLKYASERLRKTLI